MDNTIANGAARWELFSAPAADSPLARRIAIVSAIGAAAIALGAAGTIARDRGEASATFDGASGTRDQALPAWADATAWTRRGVGEQVSGVARDQALPTWAEILDAPVWAQRLLPATLRETGLYADWKSARVAADVLPFTPQYPLWSDGATKRRWIYLPGPIDTSDPDSWQFPVGTRMWKEFSFGARVETRFMIRARDGWKLATYAWTPDGSHAIRASFAGADSVRVEIGGTHGGANRHRIPSQADCIACHANGKTPVLGFSALQLSGDRDPHAVHRETTPGIDLPWLVERGLVVDGDRERGHEDYEGGRHDSTRGRGGPRIEGNAIQRAALGYLHGNCGGCHRAEGPLAGLGMVLVDGEAAMRTTVGVPSRYGAPGLRVVPGDSSRSVLVARMKARHSPAQMPPIGTVLVDVEAIRLVADWIDQLAQEGH